MTTDDFMKLVYYIISPCTNIICVDDFTVEPCLFRCQLDVIIQFLSGRHRKETSIFGLIVRIFVKEFLGIINDRYRDVV